MHVVSIYNNKGGVGKSTITVGLAEFLSANRKKRVLVIDLDSQSSSSDSLLNADLVSKAIREKRTIVELVDEMLRTRRKVRDPGDFFTTRPSSEAGGTALVDIQVLVPNKPKILDLEERMRAKRDVLVLKRHLKPSLMSFDFVLVDMPANADRRNKLVVAGLVMSDFVLIPVEPTHISLTAIPDTFDLIDYARDIDREDGRPAIIGMVRNKTDRRSQQYRRYFPGIEDAADAKELPPFFEHFLPDTPALATATDGTLDFRTLKERFSAYYDHVRKVARELEQRCDGHMLSKKVERKRFRQRFQEVLAKIGLRKRRRNKK